ncbi:MULTISPECIES: TolC family protein [unclassified Bacteroides]|jgi:outer membrane protein TolC|uniref:TolC family protein n=1 Tax=unclassified Bacteroides TaxID=2646097 RepID=UPI000E7F26D8|nr:MULTISPECIES: TolC family protein [unclassified Bacteroides]RGN43700.1 TolC family protein [Bacteroides sp. OM05-12]RHR71238.1 TolC family protein [Bacteroides sp. AF16-49]
MRRNIIIAVLFFTGITLYAQTGSMDRILRSIEQNNKELQANEHLTEARKLTDKTDNNLPDPAVSYSYTYGSPQELGKSGELTVTQGFDFPTAYSSRNKLNKLKAETLDKQYAATRRDILLRAKELCLDLILLNQESNLLSERLKNAETLAQVYEKRLQTGDANILETNKIKMELMKVQAEVVTNEATREAKLQELIAMNDNQPLTFTETTYMPVEELADFAQLKQEVLASDLNLQSLESESLAARKQITVEKSGWLPKLEIGYRRNTGIGEQFNGFIVGGSLPLFNNKNKVKASKAQSLYTDLQKESAEQQVEATLLALYSEAVKVRNTMKAYDLQLLNTNAELLKKALDSRQISMTEYFTEIENSFQTRMDYMQLENRYQKVIGQIFKNRL